jgi:hypothetical protein
MSITLKAYGDSLWNLYTEPESGDFGGALEFDSNTFKFAQTSTLTTMVFETFNKSVTIRAQLEGNFSRIYSAGTSITDLSASDGTFTTSKKLTYLDGDLIEEETYSPAVDVLLLFAADGDPTLVKLKELYAGNDVLIGSTEIGLLEGDIVAGFGGNDVFYGYGDPVNSSDCFYGGDGLDTSVYRGKIIDYSVESANDIWNEFTLKSDGVGLLVTDGASNRDGTDGLIDVERLVFADYGLAFDVDSANSAGGIYRLYQAAFDRHPDLGGLGYWIDAADGGKSAVVMGEDFTWSLEFQSVYDVKITDNYASGANVQNLVKGFYHNVLGRDPDASGLNYYTGVIQSYEKTVGRVLAEISDSPENYLLVADDIENGIRYIPYVSSAQAMRVEDQLDLMTSAAKLNSHLSDGDLDWVELIGQTNTNPLDWM